MVADQIRATAVEGIAFDNLSAALGGWATLSAQADGQPFGIEDDSGCLTPTVW
jgi:hypothetical protein